MYDSHEKFKIAVSLPGGGLRAFAYLGALRALKENDFEIEAIYGSSGGALIGAFYLMDLDFKKAFKHVSGPIWYLALIKRIFRFKLARLLKGKKIEDLPVPLFLQTINLNGGKVEVIEKGSLADYLIATSNQAIYSPFKYKGGKYIDGGLIGSYGTKFLREKGFKNIVALNVGDTKTIKIGFVSQLQMVLNLTMQEHLNKDAQINPPDYLINNLANDINSMSPFGPEKKIDSGYQRTMEHIAILKQILLAKQ